MKSLLFIKRLLFYWITSYVLAVVVYYILWLIMPKHYVFGILFRMYLYHWEYPLQYIAIPCFFYGILATLFSGYFSKTKKAGRVLLTMLIIALTILFSSPIGGMLWHYHDMKAGFFPDNWLSKLLGRGTLWGLEYGWLIIAFSVPYNIIGVIACYYITKKGSEIE